MPQSFSWGQPQTTNPPTSTYHLVDGIRHAPPPQSHLWTKAVLHTESRAGHHFFFFFLDRVLWCCPAGLKLLGSSDPPVSRTGEVPEREAPKWKEAWWSWIPSSWCCHSSTFFSSVFVFFVCFCGIWTQGLHFESFHPPFFCDGFFWIRVSWAICSGWLRTTTLLISASWVAWITGVSHQHPAVMSQKKSFRTHWPREQESLLTKHSKGKIER
jgi:hypothetical protein